MITRGRSSDVIVMVVNEKLVGVGERVVES